MSNYRRGREIYPGVDNRFVICDVCGKKFRVKDTVRIVDRYNLLNNMIVCLADADQTNPQIKPIHIQEDLLLRKDYVRPEASFYTYTNTENEDTLPTAPQNLEWQIQPLTGELMLTWNGPIDYGNGLFLGYRIYRGINILEENTNSPATLYVDESANLDYVYTYQVSIITSLGESPKSNIAYYPNYFYPIKLAISQNRSFILSLSQNNDNIVINSQNS